MTNIENTIKSHNIKIIENPLKRNDKMKQYYGRNKKNNVQ